MCTSLLVRFFLRQAAACELEEEAHLHEGTWHPLMKNGETVAGAGKYSTQIFHPYLVVDPVVKGEPRALDDGEFIEYIRGVSLEEVRERFECFLLRSIEFEVFKGVRGIPST